MFQYIICIRFLFFILIFIIIIITIVIILLIKNMILLEVAFFAPVILNKLSSLIRR